MSGNLRSFRVTGPPAYQPDVLRFLEAEGFEFEREPFSERCYRLLVEPRPLGSSLAAFFGYIYIQDRSSMLPPLALMPEKGGAILDMCASPGSKTGFLADLAGPEGFVLANEPNPARLATLRANMRLLDLPNVATCQYAGAELPLPPETWPSILLDPPCSGWGTEEKNPRVRNLWQGKKIDQLTAIQRNLLKKAARLLAPGGKLLYSTCTTNPAENERQVEYAMRDLGLALVPLDPFPGFVFQRPELDGTLLVDGANSSAQGFFLALLHKLHIASDKKNTPNAEMSRTQKDMKNQCVAAACDLSRLPSGTVGIFSEKARFLHRLAASLPPDFNWQGFLLGNFSRNGVFQPIASLKSLLPPQPSICLNSIGELRLLLAGSSISCDKQQSAAGLFWENLPLGRVRIRDGRVISAFGKI